MPDLIASIQEYLDAHNDDPRPYVWTATAKSILAKGARGRIALEKSQLNAGHTTSEASPLTAEVGG